jgi:methyl-accepting chemotaxis protein
MPKFDDQTIAIACIAIIALAMLLQAIVLLAIYLGLRKAIVAIRGEVADLRSSVIPMVENTKELVDQSRQLITRLAPKAESTVGDMARVARGMRYQIEALEFTGKDIVERTLRQTERLDAMTTEALDHVEQAGRYVAETVVRPVRQLAGIVAAAKAIVESLRGSGNEPRSARYYDDEEPFV